MGMVETGSARWIVCGLGNPGARYERTRHNAGFRVLDILSNRHGVAWAANLGGLADTAFVSIGSLRVLLVKPLTFMNRSGEVIPPLRRRFGEDALPPLIAVVDDLDLPLGKIRIRRAGSSGGQKGLASLIEYLATDRFARVRIGVGRPDEGASGAEHVLGVPETVADRELLAEAEVRAADAVVSIIAEGIDQAMNLFHGDAALPSEENSE